MGSRKQLGRRLLIALLREDTREANNSREHVREYNSAVAFASIDAEIKSPPGNGPYCFRMHDPFGLTAITKRGK
jgi:hypothetical protein